MKHKNKISIVIILISLFSLPSYVNAGCPSGQLCWSKSSCGNFNIGNIHYGGSQQCEILGINCPPPPPPLPPVNGSCGSNRWSCSSGGYAGDGVARLSGLYTWSCNGWYGGGNSGMCSYTDTTSPYLQPGCGAGLYNCNGYSGVSAKTKNGDYHTWICTNFYNGSATSCGGTYAFKLDISCPAPGNKATVSWAPVSYGVAFFLERIDDDIEWVDVPFYNPMVHKYPSGDYTVWKDNMTSFIFDTFSGGKYSFAIEFLVGNEWDFYPTDGPGFNLFECYKHTVSGSCGSANNKNYPSSLTSYGTDTFCSDGTTVQKPSFPSEGTAVTWECYGSDNATTTDDVTCSASRDAAAIINGECGSAVQIYPDTATEYGADTFCLKEVYSSDKPKFPSPGEAVAWTCLGSDNTKTTDDAYCSAAMKNTKYINTLDSIIEKFENQPASRMVNIGSKCKIDWKIRDNAVSNLTNLTCSISPVGGSSIEPSSGSGTYESPVLSHITDFTLICSGKNTKGDIVADDAPATCYVAPGVKEI